MRTWKYTAKLMEKDKLYPDYNLLGHSFGRVEAESEREAEYKAHNAAQIQLKWEHGDESRYIEVEVTPADGKLLEDHELFPHGYERSNERRYYAHRWPEGGATEEERIIRWMKLGYDPGELFSFETRATAKKWVATAVLRGENRELRSTKNLPKKWRGHSTEWTEEQVDAEAEEARGTKPKA